MCPRHALLKNAARGLCHCTFKEALSNRELTAAALARPRLPTLQSPFSGQRVACDASLKGSSATIGIAWGDPPHQMLTRSVLTPLTSSYEAEMLACALAVAGGASSVLNDNMAVVKRVAAPHPTPYRQVDSCPGLTNFVKASGTPITWTRGHTDDTSMEASLNRAADEASRQAGPLIALNTFEHFPDWGLRSQTRVVLRVTRLDGDILLGRAVSSLSALLNTRCIATHPGALAPYIKTVRTSARAVESLITLRSRALFPIRKGPARCTCGQQIDYELRHIYAECQSPAHTVTLSSLSQRLRMLGCGGPP